MGERLLAVGLWHPGSGMTRVLGSLLAPLAGRWRIDLVGIGHHGDVVERDGLRVHPAPLGGDVFGANAALRLARALDPDVILIYHDLWQLDRYARVLAPLPSSIRRVAYLALDGTIRVPEAARALLAFDQVLVFTRWAAAEVERALDGLRPAARPAIGIVPHGVDVEAFHPSPELVAANLQSTGRALVKRAVFPRLERPEESFVVLNASRPGRRKRLDLTLGGFAEFARDKPPGVRLCLHQAITSGESRAELSDGIERLGLGERIELNPLGSGRLSDEALNQLYNACDVGLNTSMGEAWGLVSCEHAAAGAAQVVPRHSALAEIWAGAAELVEPVVRLAPSGSPVGLAAVSPAAVAVALERLYREPARLERLAAAGLARVREPRWRWATIADHFESFLVAAPRAAAATA